MAITNHTCRQIRVAHQQGTLSSTELVTMPVSYSAIVSRTQLRSTDSAVVGMQVTHVFVTDGRLQIISFGRSRHETRCDRPTAPTSDTWIRKKIHRLFHITASGWIRTSSLQQIHKS